VLHKCESCFESWGYQYVQDHREEFDLDPASREITRCPACPADGRHEVSEDSLSDVLLNGQPIHTLDREQTRYLLDHPPEARKQAWFIARARARFDCVPIKSYGYRIIYRPGGE